MPEHSCNAHEKKSQGYLERDQGQDVKALRNHEPGLCVNHLLWRHIVWVVVHGKLPSDVGSRFENCKEYLR